MRNVRLRFFHKIVAIMVMVAIIPLVISLLVTNYVVWAKEVNDANERLAPVSEAIGGKVTRNAATISNGLIALSNLPLLNTRGEHPNITRSQIDNLKQNFQQIKEATLFDLQRRALIASNDSLSSQLGDWTSKEVFQNTPAVETALPSAHQLQAKPGIFYTHAIPVVHGYWHWGGAGH